MDRNYVDAQEISSVNVEEVHHIVHLLLLVGARHHNLKGQIVDFHLLMALVGVYHHKAQE
jgi:hypothetical protein